MEVVNEQPSATLVCKCVLSNLTYVEAVANKVMARLHITGILVYI